MSSLVLGTKSYTASLRRNSQAAAVPILTTHTRELQQAHEKMEAYILEDGEQLINFQAFEELWRSVKEIVKYKAPEEHIPRDPAVSGYLDHALLCRRDGSELSRLFKSRSERVVREEIFHKEASFHSGLVAAGM
ncbi:hypothetical protein FRC12_018085 [Ceratobasidium sp. 428]|nr:hypothetical protein FRC12_018085 [Ceratobasidium sp. 428]